jgi:thiamine-monophosphate kinase
MSVGEFDLIRRFFSKRPMRQAGTSLGIGDDCALIQLSEGYELALSVDTLVSGTHFFPNVDPESLGHKALAVNLSDLAAMGASPKWVTLALTLPETDEIWLEAFSQGFFALADRFDVDLIGGDTTRGPLSITIQVMGEIPKGLELRRSGASAGDIIYVSGPLGSAGLGLKIRQGLNSYEDDDCLRALERPEPKIILGTLLRGFASAAIDVSDGLISDLGHILEASHVGARIDFNHLPLSKGVHKYIQATHDYEMPITAGDDYELCFTVPQAVRDNLERWLAQNNLNAFAIGEIQATPGIEIYHQNERLHTTQRGYEHFSS